MNLSYYFYNTEHCLFSPLSKLDNCQLGCIFCQWRNNRSCKACSARGPSAVGAQNLPDVVFKKFFGEEGALLEYLHAGPLQPCYATVFCLCFFFIFLFFNGRIFRTGISKSNGPIFTNILRLVDIWKGLLTWYITLRSLRQHCHGN